MDFYICGKIGEEVISEATQRKFQVAQDLIEHMGHTAFNPTDPEWQLHLKKSYEKDKGIWFSPFPDF